MDFLKFETETNPMIKALGLPELTKELKEIVTTKATLFLPQSVSFQTSSSSSFGIISLASLVRTHAAILNNNQFATLGGLLGIIEGNLSTTGTLILLGSTSKPPNESDLSSVFTREKEAFTVATLNKPFALILREGEITICGETIHILLISEPLTNITSKQTQQQQQQQSPPPIANIVQRQPAKKSAFFPKLRLPEASNVVKELNTFAKKYASKVPKTAEEQSNLLHSFSDKFSEHLLSTHPLWKGCSQEESLDILDGIEKYLTVKLFSVIFPLQEESKRDEKFITRAKELWFVTRDNLDVPNTCSEETILLAVKELQTLDNYKCPIDKITVVLNCCKILLSSGKEKFGADELLPMLIYVVLKSVMNIQQFQPQSLPHLSSDIEFMALFRNPRRMATEARYCITMLRSAIGFVIEMTASSISIDPQQFHQLISQNPPMKTNSIPLQQTTETSTISLLASSLPVEISATNTTRSRRSSDAVSTISPLSPFEIAPSSCSALDDFWQSQQQQTPIPHRFVNMKVEDLKICDIPLLLSEYKELVSRVLSLEISQKQQTNIPQQIFTPPTQTQTQTSLSPTVDSLL